MKTTQSQDPRLIILSNGYMNSSKSCLIKMPDSNTYLINCGEGTQRAYFQTAAKCGLINNILITKFDWRTIGGLSAFGKINEDSPLTVHNRCTNIHSPMLNHAKYHFLGKKYRELFLDAKFKMKEYDYAANNGVFSQDGLTIRNIVMKMASGAGGGDQGVLPCFSYLFTFPKKLPRLNMEAIQLEVRRG